jgi:hypothetical protein
MQQEWFILAYFISSLHKLTTRCRRRELRFGSMPRSRPASDLER